VSWQLSLVLDRLNPGTIALSEGVPNTNCVPPNFVAYYSVFVPTWAQFATNTLTVNNGNLSLLFNQNVLPLTTNGDYALLTNVTTTSNVTLNPFTPPPLMPGQEYYLAVTNSNTTNTACFTIEVDFNITTLTNMVPVTNTLAASMVPYYYQYYVPSNTPATAFLLYNLSGNATLVAQLGLAPALPTTNSYSYLSSNPGTNDDIIVVTSNSAPVILTPGWWYLGVFNNSTNTLTYTIEAANLTPTTIPLTNDERFTTNFSLVTSLETFFTFDITNSPAGALYELYHLNGNADLTLDSNAYPYSPPFFGQSANPGTNGQQIVTRTNAGMTNINALWYLGVPIQAATNVTFTIHAVVTDSNGLLVPAIPISPVVTFPIGGTNGPTLTWATIPGECYEVDYTSSLSSPLWLPLPNTPVTASGTTTTVTDPTPITGIPARYYRIVQVNCDEGANLTPMIIPLTNDERYAASFSPLASQETFFSFNITNSPAGALFELYNMDGNVDLALDFNKYPFSTPYSAESANPGTNGQQIVIRTNAGMTNINGLWYLSVPNNTTSNVSFTIHAVETGTNGLLVSAVPINPTVTVHIGGPSGPTLTWATVAGECYDVDYTTSLSPPTWIPLPGMPVTATSTTLSVTDPTPITGMPPRYYRILQVACP
jgi:hypothetical protein